MSAIERCRSAELGGHVLACKECAEVKIAYNSCRNRHCPKCQGSTARRWLADRQAELLPVRVLPCGIHIASAGGTDRLPEPSAGLRPAVQGERRDLTYHCRRLKTSRCQDRIHRRAAHLGFSDDTSSAPALHCAWRWYQSQPTLATVQAWLLSTGARVITIVPAVVFGTTHRIARSTQVLR